MYCPKCNEDRGEYLFKTFFEYDDLNKRPNCPVCRETLERKAVQRSKVGSSQFGITHLDIDGQDVVPGFL